MDTTVMKFNFGSSGINVVEDSAVRRGHEWVLVEICRALDLSYPTDVASRLDKDEYRTVRRPNNYSRRNSLVSNKGDISFFPKHASMLILVNESGLYNVILQSRKPQAKEFKRWITHEVLPQIRKTGSYGATQVVPRWPSTCPLTL